MCLWHQHLLPKLSTQYLLGQHRECCALRGNGWGRKHSTVDYVFIYCPSYLVAYHFLVIDLLEKRGVTTDPLWSLPCYRGKSCQPYLGIDATIVRHNLATLLVKSGEVLYPEHDDNYMLECISNLISKGKSNSAFV